MLCKQFVLVQPNEPSLIPDCNLSHLVISQLHLAKIQIHLLYLIRVYESCPGWGVALSLVLLWGGGGGGNIALDRGTPPPEKRASACYAADSTPLAVMQEDCLVTDRGKVMFSVCSHLGGYPDQVQMGGGTPARSRWGGGTPASTPSLDLSRGGPRWGEGTPPRVPPLSRSWLGWGGGTPPRTG